jgi:hypothetical protein
MPDSFAYMLAHVRACQLCTPTRVASSSSTCKYRASGPFSPQANAPRSHVPMCCARARAACTCALRRAARSSRLLPRAHAPGHFQSSPAHDRARADQCAITISACVPSHPPGRVSRPPWLCVACLSVSPASANPARPVPETPDLSAPQRQPAINSWFSFPPGYLPLFFFARTAVVTIIINDRCTLVSHSPSCVISAPSAS